MVSKPVRLSEFRKYLPQSFWLQERCAVAVSGGADSIALTLLINEASNLILDGPSVYAFTVDHGLRQKSGREALEVQQLMQSKGIRHSILTIPTLNRNSSAIETDARLARYTALSRACNTYKISSLYLAHHEDDQVETLLLRLIGGTRWPGLTGMHTQSHNPVSRLVHGSHGILLHRPLLSFPKSRLVATCRSQDMIWMEDPTNEEAGYTIRNAIRKILKRPEQLPTALHAQSLLDLSKELKNTYEHLRQWKSETAAECDVILCKISGTLSFLVKPVLKMKNKDFVAYLLHDFCMVVSPAVDVRHDRAVRMMEALVQHSHSEVEHKATAGGVVWTLKHGRCTLSRQPSMRSEKPIVQVPNTSQKSWNLFDRRYWIHVDGHVQDLVIRNLRKSDMSQLRQLATLRNVARDLELVLTAAQSSTRFTLPVIVFKDESRLVALPSAGLCFDNDIAVQCEFNGQFLLDRILQIDITNDSAI